MEGVVDSGADIMIMGGTMFKHVAAVAKSRKKDFKLKSHVASIPIGRPP